MNSGARYAAAALALATLALPALALPSRALAADWARQEFADDHFAVALPIKLTPGKTQIVGPSGQPLAENLYSGREEGAAFEVAVADLSGLNLQEQAALDFGAKIVTGAGKVRVSVSERIDRVFGRDLTVDMPDGAQVTAAVFFVQGKLYMLQGKALPPDPAATSSQAMRFQQSLEFIGFGFEAGRPENRRGGGDVAGLGPGGPGFGQGRRRGPPPPEALAACKDKSEGDQVQFDRPDGRVVQARCMVTPQGLAARPQRRARGAPDGNGSPDGGGPPPEGGGPPPA